MRRSVIAVSCTLAIALASAAAVRAQEPATLCYGEVAHLDSKALDEDRRLNILLPAGYADSGSATARYPVVYLLDGSAHEDYLHVAGLVDFFATYGVVPPSIVVGISNVDRRRDFTRPSASAEDRKTSPTSGGADRFVAFLESDLLPWVDARYRTTAGRTLIGQSFGGLLATQILLEKPALFTQYIIVSPSLWWDGEALLHGATQRVAAHPAPDRAVYLSVAREGAEMTAADTRLAAMLRDAHWPGLRVKLDTLPDETHATSLHISVYNGLKFLNSAAH